MATLRVYDVPFATTAAFVTYVALGITLPGALWWRFVNRGSGTLAEDFAAGTAVGYALEVLAYVPARLAGVPWLVLAVPLTTAALFVSLPALRPYWRRSSETKVPAIWSWSLSLIVAVLVSWSALRFFRLHGIPAPYYASTDTDMPFHLAVIGEIRHHMPPVVPFLTGQPLLYHWFVYAEIAATSWITGIDAHTLLYRLSLLPMLAAFVVLVAVAARRLTLAWWTGPAAVILSLFVLAPVPYAWPFVAPFDLRNLGPVDDGSLLRPAMWTSPTQTFGTVLFVPVVILLVDLVREHRQDRRRWFLFALLVPVLMGAKATFLPLLLAGLLSVMATQILRGHILHRPALSLDGGSLHRPALLAACYTLGWLVFAQLVLFGGTSQGLHLRSLGTMATWGIAKATGVLRGTGGHAPVLALVTLIFVICWACIWSGIAGLAIRRRILQAEIVLLLGMGAAAIGAVLLLEHPGFSQGFFLISARPYLSLAATCGLAAVLRGRRMTWRLASALLSAVAFGAVAVWAVRALGSSVVPRPVHSGGVTGTAIAIAWPFALLICIASIAGIRAFAFARNREALRGIPPALVIAMLAGFGVNTSLLQAVNLVRDSQQHGWRHRVEYRISMARGTMEAGHWLRDHSSAGDLVATNAHCLPAASSLSVNRQCDNRHVAVSAFTERRVLIEGWAFNADVHSRAQAAAIPGMYVPFWNQGLLTDNDAAFYEATAETVGLLQDRYGVRWLFVDATQGAPSARLGDFAVLRFQSGDCSVYEIMRVRSIPERQRRL